MIDEEHVIINLEDLITHQTVVTHKRGSIYEAKQQGELNGLNMAIDLIRQLAADAKKTDD